MRIHRLTPDEALLSLQSGPAGLTETEAQRRLKEFGPNLVQRATGEPVLWRLLKEFTHFFALILWVAAGLAFWAEGRDPGQGMGTLGGAIIGVIVVNGLFSFGQVYRAEQSLAALEKLLPHQVKVLRDGAFHQIPSADLVPGDVISLEAGDLIPADCRLLQAFGVRVNTATLTGESAPQGRDAQPSSEEHLPSSRNVLLAGTTLVSGDGRGVVYATGGHTEFGRMAHLAQTAGDTSFPLQKEIAFVSRLVALVATGMGLVFFLIGLTIPLSFTQNFLFAVGIIVANVPEGLLPTVTLALAMGAQRMARRNVLIRRLPAVETLGSATVICTDKTGTLTENRMRVHSIFLAGAWHDVSRFEQFPELANRHQQFFEALHLCHSLRETLDHDTQRFLGDPTEVALAELGLRVRVETPDARRVNEVPFDSDRRRMSTLYQRDQGLVLYAKGAVESLLPLCSTMHAVEGVAPLTPASRTELMAIHDRLAHGGMRVLAVASRELNGPLPIEQLEEELTFLGFVGLDDPPRPEVPDAIRRCREAGIRVVMLTGDHPQTAVAIARQIALIQGDSPVVMTGDTMRHLSDTQLQLALDAPEIVFARIEADQKMRIVQALQKKGEVVAVTGDGVNDAPALRQADIGIAMGVTGTDVARATADMVLTDDNFASIVAAVEEGRAVFDNIRKFLTYILASNVPEIVPYLAFALFRIPLPLSVIQILAIDLGTDMLPALALGAEPPDSRSMERPPRLRTERLLDVPLLLRAYLFLGLIEAVAALAAFFVVLFAAGWQFGQPIGRHDPLFGVYQQATTACLAAIVLMQVANVFLCRSEQLSARTLGLLSNRLILSGIAFEITLLLLIVYTPWGNRLFETAPLAGWVWLFVLPFFIGMILLENIRKAIVRRKFRIGNSEADRTSRSINFP
ncbi:MAG: cation-translocating P-type ATPase [Planctomycetales bacterium]